MYIKHELDVKPISHKIISFNIYNNFLFKSSILEMVLEKDEVFLTWA